MADHKLDELARIEFTGSLAEAFGDYARAWRELSQRWEVELGLAAGDVRAALLALKVRRTASLEQVLAAPHREAFALLYSPAERRVKAWRVARRLRRAQTLVASITKYAEAFPREYAKQFLQASKDGKGGKGGGAA